MVYGSPIRIPGDFFQEYATKLDADLPQFVSQLKQCMNRLKPVQYSHKAKERPFIHRDLNESTHVFVRVDRVKKALEPPYEGPYEVIERTPKFFGVKRPRQEYLH